MPRNSVTAVESLLKIDFGPPSEQVGTLPENASSTSKIKQVQMDKSRSMSLNPDIREVPVVSSPMKAVELAANASILVATAPTVVPKYSIATAKVLHTPPANQLNSKVAPIIIVAPLSTAKTGSKNPKKPTPTAGIGRSRASSESRLNLKNHAEEEDRVVTEEVPE